MVAGRVKKKHKDGSYILHRYYHCGAWRNKGTAACRSNGVKADETEKIVFNKIQSNLLNEKLLSDIVNNLNEKRRHTIKPLEEQLQHIDREIRGYDNKKSKWFELFEDGMITKEDLSKRLGSISEDIEIKRKHKESIQEKLRLNNSDPIEFQVVKNLMSNLNEIIRNANHDQKKTILNLVVDKIVLSKERKVESIILHFDGKSKNHILDEKEDGSSVEDPSSFNFTLVL
ncbi:zinc ribbon domain-containing protein [Falsibacillus albus]|uniref:zinc ribbon domain-containing protein n=1 Tax=Falsibacillus albus TaxID=2478915 RepID=UPI001F3EEF7B|nr:zinc ribbon domain-containing protein [Falsibacillus albus]